MSEELAGAARLGIPIVPVLLSPTPAWENRLIDGDKLGRRLGALNAVPINGKSGPQPIRGGNWTSRDLALSQAAEQLASRLMRDDAPDPQRLLPQRKPLHSLPALLPNLCNQQPSESSFESGLDAWTPEQALLVLVKGEFSDDTPGFWERLCHKNLADFCEIENLPLRSPRPLELPPATDGGKPVIDLQAAIRRKVSEALFGNARRMRSAADLAALLVSDGGLLPLCTTLPVESTAATATLLGSLLTLIDETPANTPLRRLVIAVLVENPALVSQDNLIELLQLRGHRTHVVETRRLQALTDEEVKRWYRQHGLDAPLQIDEEQFVERIFKGASTLRHRPFTQQVRPLLGQTAKETGQ